MSPERVGLAGFTSEIQPETDAVCVAQQRVLLGEEVGEIEPQVEDAQSRADGPVARVVVAPFAVVVAGAQLHELHQVVLGAQRHLETADRGGREIVAQVSSDRDFVRIGEERVEGRAHGEIHRQGVFRIAEIPAQIAQLGACAQRRVAADVLQRPLPRGAQIHGQRVG